MSLRETITFLLRTHGLKPYDTSFRAGLGPRTFYGWKTHSPHAHKLEALLNAMGYQLVISPKGIPLYENQYTIDGTRGDRKDPLSGDNPSSQGTFHFVDGARD
jgi:hypothetical protein